MPFKLDDSAPANVSAGTGGVDASIGFETLRAENSGAAMNDTLKFFANYTSAAVSSMYLEMHLLFRPPVLTIVFIFLSSGGSYRSGCCSIRWIMRRPQDPLPRRTH